MAQVGDEPPLLTRAAYQRLDRELEELVTVRRPEIAERIRRAREHGDIRENAEYDAAKDEQGMLEARIRQIEHMLKHAQVVEAPLAADEVVAGTLVTLRPEGDPEDQETYLVAASSEERARGARTVTMKSPLGQALVGRRPGEVITYEAPGGSFSYEIVEIKPWDGA